MKLINLQGDVLDAHVLNPNWKKGYYFTRKRGR